MYTYYVYGSVRAIPMLTYVCTCTCIISKPCIIMATGSYKYNFLPLPIKNSRLIHWNSYYTHVRREITKEWQTGAATQLSKTLITQKYSLMFNHSTTPIFILVISLYTVRSYMYICNSQNGKHMHMCMCICMYGKKMLCLCSYILLNTTLHFQ